MKSKIRSAQQLNELRIKTSNLEGIHKFALLYFALPAFVFSIITFVIAQTLSKHVETGIMFLDRFNPDEHVLAYATIILMFLIQVGVYKYHLMRYQSYLDFDADNMKIVIASIAYTEEVEAYIQDVSLQGRGLVNRELYELMEMSESVYDEAIKQNSEFNKLDLLRPGIH